MRKLRLGAVGVLVLLVAALWLSIDRIVGTAIERVATRALGVESRVGFVRLRLLDGDLGMSRVRIANPEGFDEPHFLAVSSAEIAVDLGSLREPVVEIPLIAISGVDVALEREGRRTNFDAILDHMRSFEKSARRRPTPSRRSASW